MNNDCLSKVDQDGQRGAMAVHIFIVVCLAIPFLLDHLLKPIRSFPFHEALLVERALPPGSVARLGTCSRVEKPSFVVFGCTFDLQTSPDQSRAFFESTLSERGWTILARNPSIELCRSEERLKISWQSEHAVSVYRTWAKDSVCGK